MVAEYNTENERIALGVRSVYMKNPSIDTAEDYLEAVKLVLLENPEKAREHNKQIVVYTEQAAQGLISASDKEIERFYNTREKTLLIDAPVCFDSYMQYLEWGRAAKDRFYIPRRRVLKQAVDCIQELCDGLLDEFALSLPARVGKTTLLMFLNSWLVGRDSERSNLYSAYSDVITSAFYRGTLEILTDPVTYKWHDVFPDASIVETNAKDETLNIDRKKRYPSLTCRSLYGTLNGACDCNGFLISDDLIGGIEEAMNRDRLASAWSKVDNNLLPRAKETAKILWCGTRWAESDPIGIRLDLLKNEEKYKHRRIKEINIPALNDKDESNFDYPYKVGYSTAFYHQRRASFERNNDMASWLAQYQGEPIERSGALFAPEDMKTYNGTLPPGEPDRILMAVDPAWGGTDFVSAPVGYDYGGDIYVADVVYNDGDKKITRPLIIAKILDYNVQAAHFEANKMTEDYKDYIEEGLKAEGYSLNITSSPAPNNTSKEIRIFDRAPEIREFYFLEDGKRSKEYSQFMQNLYAFKIKGKNKNDDAPDSLAIMVDMVRGVRKGRVEIFKRPF